MLKIHGDVRSGNSYKVALTLHQLDLPHEWVFVDLFDGSTRAAEFRARNPLGKLPLLEVEDGVYLRESNAILCYLARGTPLLPDAPLDQARVLQWLFYEQHDHEPAIAGAHLIAAFLGRPEKHEQTLQKKLHQGYRVLGLMDQHLAERSFFVGERCTIADIALYAYTHIAHEATFDLSDYSALSAWLQRVRDEPAHVSRESLLEEQGRR